MEMAEMWGAYIGDPVDKQSLKFAWMEECCGGGRFPEISDRSRVLMLS